MSEYADELMEETASEFIVATCQLLPKSYYAASDRIHIHFATAISVPKTYAMDCGSSAEFYIRPVNTLIDDRDTFTGVNLSKILVGHGVWTIRTRKLIGS